MCVGSMSSQPYGCVGISRGQSYIDTPMYTNIEEWRHSTPAATLYASPHYE